MKRIQAPAKLDPVRRLILDRIDDLRLDLANASRKMGRNHAYLQQFVHRGIPLNLPEDGREKLAPILGVAPEQLRGKLTADIGDSSGPEVGDPTNTDSEEAILALWRDLTIEQRDFLLSMAESVWKLGVALRAVDQGQVSSRGHNASPKKQA